MEGGEREGCCVSVWVKWEFSDVGVGRGGGGGEGWYATTPC